MVNKRDLIRFAKSGYRKAKRFINNRRVQQTLFVTYKTYSVIRIIRNPFILLEYINVFNGLRMLQN